MCRNIKTLFNFEPPATEAEIRAAALRFVRKVSGFHTPSRVNAVAFGQAVDGVAAAARTLLDSLATTAAPRDRAVEAMQARARATQRFGAGRAGESRPAVDLSTQDGWVLARRDPGGGDGMAKKKGKKKKGM